MDKVFQDLGLVADITSGNLVVRSPIDGHEMGRVHKTRPQDVNQIIMKATQSSAVWRLVPSPQRGELVRLFGEELRAHKESLSRLVTLETGKILAENSDLPLLSATGSARMGRAVGTAVATRLGRCLLEFSGNAAMILTPSADLDLAVQAISFAALGTAVRQEIFAPLLYVMPYGVFADALEMHNDVSQGLASCIFTNDIREAKIFLSACGSDCGIANVNSGPSGAEIGGAFGGEKATGGGREAGSDAWKNYMRCATNTINYSYDLSLAQGIHFGGGHT